MPDEALTLATDRTEDRVPRRCTRCRKWKTRDQFARNRSRTDGLSSQCKQCLRIGQHERYHEGGGKEAVAAYHARPEVQARRREYDRTRKGRRDASSAAYRKTPRGKIVECRCTARRKLRLAATDGRRAELEALIAAYDREIARIDAEREAELPLDPAPRHDDCDYRGVHRRHGAFTVLVSLPGGVQVRGGSHATIEAARAEADRIGREHGIDGYAVPKRRRA